MNSSIGLRAALCTLAFGTTASTLQLARADETPAPSSAPSALAPPPEAAPPPPADLAAASAETSMDATPTPTPPPAVRPAPYSLPFMLRPAAVANVVRADTSFAAYENTASKHGFTVAPTVSGAYKIPGTGEKWAGLAAIVRLAAANDSPPTGSGGFGIVNPLVAANYVVPLGGGLRAAFFLGATVPVGMGGGDTPDKGAAEARAVAIYARSAKDNSLYAVNDFALIPGADLAWVGHNWTVQAEATLFQLWRVRGDKVQHEATKTNFTTGLHVGYFFVPEFSLGAELHYQRWLNAPLAVDKDPTDTLVDNLTIMLGPRFHIPLGGGASAHPGIAYGFGLDKPMAPAVANYHIVQVDVPFVF